MDLAVTVVAVPNNPATGTVVFLILKPGSEERPLTAADTLTVGDTLTATVVGLADPDLYRTTVAESEFTWTWYRLDGATETAIAGATDASYELTLPTDAGKHVRAKARFEDLLGNGETLASRRIGPVMFPAGSACMTPAAVANGSVELIWTAEVGVAGTRAGFTSYGYSSHVRWWVRQPVGPRFQVRERQLHGRHPDCALRRVAFRPGERPAAGDRGRARAACLRRGVRAPPQPRRLDLLRLSRSTTPGRTISPTGPGTAPGGSG